MSKLLSSRDDKFRVIDRLPKKCPICSTAFPPTKRKPLCSHVKWSHKAQTFVLRKQKRHDDVQEQKYALNPLWRRRR